MSVLREWGSTDAAGERRLDGRAGMQGAQHDDRFNGRQRQLGRDIKGYGGEAEHADLQRLPRFPHGAQVVCAEVLDA